VKPFTILPSIVLTGAFFLGSSQLVRAEQTIISGVEISSEPTGLRLTLTTTSNRQSQLFAITKDLTWQVDITNARLQLPQGDQFSREKPTAGIASLTIVPINSNSVRLTVIGDKRPPNGQIFQRTTEGISFNISNSRQPFPTSNTLQNRRGLEFVQPPTQSTPLVPNPKVSIDPQSLKPSPIPLQLSRAVPPPVGDISISTIDSSPFLINLNTEERVPRLVVRDAPAREVLAVLARAAGLNFLYLDSSTESPDPANATTLAQTISLDIENEPVQNVFNYVLRITNLEANRVGRTIFVGKRLPDAARNILTRSFRLNQVAAEQASAFLSTQGAETQISTTRVRVETIGTPPNQRVEEIREPTIITLRGEPGVGALNLRGLSVSVDSRLNVITLVGNPRQVELATSMLVQLDARKRQVAVNVKVIDVNLINQKIQGSSFSFGSFGFGVDDSRIIQTGGVGIINFGAVPAQSSLPSGTPLGTAPTTAIAPVPFNFIPNFLLQLQSTIVSGSGKILTDPILIVQEGQKASISLTEEVISEVTSTVSPGTPPTITVSVKKDNAGLTLDVIVNRIDDNGFVTLQVNPEVSGISGTSTIAIPSSPPTTQQVALLQKRQVNSGLIRLKDGQTLVLSGIIRDSDRSTVQKIPFLGDIPLLGALFRRTETNRTRNEVIVLVTPRILDDSDSSNYGYQLSPDAQELLNKK